MTSESFDLPSVDEQREELRTAVFEAPRKYRIVFVGNFFQGPTGIVASLHRGLVNVGHTVFKFDTAVHKNFLDKSSGAKGGYGPVFFRPHAVERIFEVFAPQVIVFCAGGIVLDSDAAEYFRDRDVLTIGLTLSDPDVQDSVIDYVGNYDVHTTNAKLSLERYRREGHTNTVLMPFGIDRSFVLRDVAPAPELRADAICIGHAEGRPDRHEVMVPLAERVAVRTYGSGWPLPNSESVSGDKLLQAAKAGSVHVNFPATRAGFTNVKCGVFETIGAGAILATTRFDEMADLFSYGDEIIGYTGAEDLGDTLVSLIADPDRMEQIRRRGFKRLVTEHLYEQRWLSLFEEIETSLSGKSSLIETRSAQRFTKMLEGTRDRPRNIIISGYFGARNRGDDILLDALANRITAAVPDAKIVAAAVNQQVVEREQGIQAFKRTDLWVSEHYASEATGLILGPGGLWHDYTIQAAGGVAGIFTGATLSPAHLAQLPLMVKAHGGRFHIHGMGVGPLADPAAKAAIRLTGSLADSTTVRDQGSLDLLNEVATDWPNPPSISPDVAYSLPLPEAETTSTPRSEQHDRYIVVNVRPFRDDADSLETIRSVVFGAAAARNWRVVGVPMQPIDETTMAQWAEHSPVPFSILPQDVPYEKFLEVLRDASAIVSMRLHLNLFAHRLGKNPVGIAYDPKLVGHFEQLGREAAVVPMPVQAETLTRIVNQGIDHPAQTARVSERVRRAEDDAIASLDALCRDLASAPVRVPDSSSMVHEPSRASNAAKPRSAWPQEEGLALTKAEVSGRNSLDSSREVPVSHRVGHTGSTFFMDVRAPVAGDSAEWRYSVPFGDNPGLRIELWIKQKYAEKRRFAGRIAYEVLVNGTLLFAQDVTDWQPRNSVWIAARRPTVDAGANEPTVEITIRLKAMRNCEDWNWGKATALTIEAARALRWEPTGDLLWGASSPFANVDRPLANVRTFESDNSQNDVDSTLTGPQKEIDAVVVNDARVASSHIEKPTSGEDVNESAVVAPQRPWWKFW
ncbi:polysaccharide pyruvyl transferase family protein [Brevibacterium sp. 2SA]|uniref:polysaccharide pyruvyl transferase family protein n=1 Tax=Brevibacterium sp. 2SA TaxID=2502198 RepID=UPI0010F4CBED|nr:polysaccharide pyruvyl transferase family protein [Brevibacterium sp. 2SA]